MTIYGVTVRLYRHRYRALPVTLHLQRDHRFHWTWILGLQIGPWFFGAIKGSAVDQSPTHCDLRAAKRRRSEQAERDVEIRASASQRL
jgi:hypothetical protein